MFNSTVYKLASGQETSDWRHPVRRKTWKGLHPQQLEDVAKKDGYWLILLCKNKKQNIQQRGFASGHPPNY
jgi:hypothetical protein